MRTILLWCLMVLVSVLLFCPVAWAQEVTVSGSGASRDDAIRDALRLAVEQAVGVLISSESRTRNYQLISDEVYTKSLGFVQDYRILSEYPNKTYTVTATVTVNTDPTSALYTRLQQLRLIEVMLRDPRIAVVIPEYFHGSPTPVSGCETVVIQSLRSAGFKHVLDTHQVSDNQKTNLIRAILDGNYQEAKVMATTQQLDFVIIGEATSQYVGDLYDSGVKSSRAHVDARVLKVDTGEIIAAQGFDASGVDITPQSSAQKARVLASSQLANAIAELLVQYASVPDKPVTITIKQISFQKLTALESVLKQIPGVKAVFLRSYNGGIAEIDVTYPGAPKILAETMENAEGISILITGITNSTVTAVLN
ncbi:MAG: hypothetical protein H6Q73_109 [Firmicutes bacterium]|nr:hypothetical protein [Bacillota bacterium]